MNNVNIIKRISIAMACGLISSVLLCFAGFDARCTDLKQNVLRLHILANSNTDEDQEIKLAVRDRILLVSESIFDNVTDKEQAIEKAKSNIPIFTSEAKKIIKQYGKDYTVKIEIGKSDFDTRVYENFTLPAGEYDSVRVLIGKAIGKNWWCVMFPSMCIPAAENRHELNEAVSDSAATIAEHPQKYKIGFKTAEIYEDISQKLKSLFK